MNDQNTQNYAGTQPQQTCPCCGYCPACGRRNCQPPYYVPQPWGGTNPWGGTTIGTTGVYYTYTNTGAIE